MVSPRLVETLSPSEQVKTGKQNYGIRDRQSRIRVPGTLQPIKVQYNRRATIQTMKQSKCNCVDPITLNGNSFSKGCARIRHLSFSVVPVSRSLLYSPFCFFIFFPTFRSFCPHEIFLQSPRGQLSKVRISFSRSPVFIVSGRSLRSLTRPSVERNLAIRWYVRAFLLIFYSYD